MQVINNEEMQAKKEELMQMLKESLKGMTDEQLNVIGVMHQTAIELISEEAASRLGVKEPKVKVFIVVADGSEAIPMPPASTDGALPN